MNAHVTFTETLGFSQTYQWYTGQPFPFPISDPTFEPQKTFLSTYKPIAGCQARFGFGGDLTKWKDPDFIGYTGHVVHNLQQDRTRITRLIFNISGESRAGEDWRGDIENVIEILLGKYPNLEELSLQPVIGGIGPAANVRCVKNHPHILAAIKTIVSHSPHALLKVGVVIELPSEWFNDT
ncbi:MAG TPA: hypothetical protein VJ508_20015, partial [Saprospiraceae bacterium]|nr:hypothetical protein [Saprospiraceae bacterium]